MPCVYTSLVLMFIMLMFKITFENYLQSLLLKSTGWKVLLASYTNNSRKELCCQDDSIKSCDFKVCI